MTESKNSLFNRYYALLVTCGLAILGFHLPTMCLLGANAYVGNNSMVQFGSFMVYFIASNVIFHSIWLGIFISKFALVKYSTSIEPKKNWQNYFAKFKETFEYKSTVTVWAILATSLFVIQATVYLYITINTSVGFWGNVRLSDPFNFIGSSGNFGLNDDLFQVTALLNMLFGFFSMMFFIKLNALIYFYGISEP
jgi:uncharacterized membrane protein YidH (DUF202 family)